MGYFDGLGGVSVQGSSFEIGRILGLPAILVWMEEEPAYL